MVLDGTYKTTMTLIVKSAAGLALILALASCASVSVHKTAEQATPQMPQKIYVADFDVANGNFKVDREGLNSPILNKIFEP
jgi:Flp pilus assembly protein CpaB